LISILLEKLIVTLVEEGETLFRLKPKKDDDGYTYLKLPFTYYFLPSIFMILFSVCVFAILIGKAKNEMLLAIGCTTGTLVGGVLSFLYVKNTSYKFNEKEICKHSSFRKQKTIYWNESKLKPINIISQQITIYNDRTTFKIHRQFVGYKTLAKLIENKFGLSPKETGNF
jgi:hypothetical protein